MTQTPQLPIAGWYPDPAAAGLQRYWNGATWTSATAPLSSPAAAFASSQPQLSPEPNVYAVPTGRWGLGDVAWLVLVAVGAVVLGVALVIGVAVGGDSSVVANENLNVAVPTGAWLAVASQMLVMAGLGLWPVIVGCWKGPGWRRAFGFVPSLRALWVGAVGGVATFVVLVALTALASVLFGTEVDAAAAELVADMESVTVAYAVFLLLIAVGAPFVEEIAFRGLLWGAIVKRGWSPWIATIVSGVAFGLFHFEPLRVVPLIAAGVVLGIVRHYAGLAASMLSHCVVNTIGVITLLAV